MNLREIINKLSPEQRAVRGEQAERELGGQVGQAFDTLKEEYFKAWSATKPENTELREKLFQFVRVVDVVRSHLVHVVNDGKLAQDEITRSEKRSA